MSVLVTLAYPAVPGARFDYDYYEHEHRPLVARLWEGTGFQGSEAMRGLASPDGGPPQYFAIAVLRFASVEAFQAAIQSEAGAKVLADVANYTTVEPTVQVNAPLWDTQQRA
ncbi:EthD family reductase [Altererythrobacter soli]|uniref:EthD family reductase n=1 Tax=Croceibacterium soli TaxID=1739690 RepID=A0A6I4UTJ6_9SPHN|nr:EthD family reductase [Croceibacterium soli]MXP41094.1 EthD family reductase [Croceibacterium soli]